MQSTVCLCAIFKQKKLMLVADLLQSCKISCAAVEMNNQNCAGYRTDATLNGTWVEACSGSINIGKNRGRPTTLNGQDGGVGSESCGDYLVAGADSE
jgi:hypothetical protein